MPVHQRSADFIAFGGGVALYAGDGGDTVDLTQPIDVEIALSGQYKTRNFELGTVQFDQIIANHKASNVDPAVDREHESWFSLGGNSPALGWVSAMRVEQASGDARRKALVATVKLNDLGQAAVRNGHFRYVSMGFDKAAKHPMTGEPIGARLDHLALVKNPFIQGMRPLSLALSSKLGRPVEEEPMEQLAQQLRTMLGLSADAPEEQIITALDALNKRTQTALSASDEALKAAAAERDEQKRVNARLETELTRLSKAADERETREWLSTVDAAVKDFRLTPAEADEHKALAGAERAVAARLLAKRVGNKPAQAVTTTKALTTRGTNAEGLSAAQIEAVEAFKKAAPGSDDHDALMGAMAANPALFANTAEG